MGFSIKLISKNLILKMKTNISAVKYCCVAILLMLSSSVLAQRINVNPTIINYNASAGEASAQIITITNLSDKKQAYQLSLGDWERDTTGGHTYFAAGTQKRSCSDWLSFDNTVVEVEPQKSRDVRVTLTAPADPLATSQMKWAMIFIQNVQENTGDENKGGKMKATIREVYRIGIHVYQTPSAAIQKEAKAISLEPDALVKNMYNFTMSNTGKAMLECKVHLVLTNLATGAETKLDDFDFPVFPDGKRIVKLAIPETLEKGKYSMLAVLDYDPDMPLEAIESSDEIK